MNSRTELFLEALKRRGISAEAWGGGGFISAACGGRTVVFAPASLAAAHAQDWPCFESLGADAPYPKLLVRADGEAYACSYFAHVFGLGNIRRRSLRDMIEEANRHPVIRLVARRGILGLLEDAERRAPRIGERLVPPNSSLCYLCRLLSAEI